MGARVRRPRGGGRRAGHRAARHAPRGGRGGDGCASMGWLTAVAQFAPACARPTLERLSRYEGRLRGETSGERLVLACLAFGAAHLGDLGERDRRATRGCAIGGGRLLHDHRPGSATYYLASWALVYADRLERGRAAGSTSSSRTSRARGSMASFGRRIGLPLPGPRPAGTARRGGGRGAAACSDDDPACTPPARAMVLSCLLRHDARARRSRASRRRSSSSTASTATSWATAMAGMLLFYAAATCAWPPATLAARAARLRAAAAPRRAVGARHAGDAVARLPGARASARSASATPRGALAAEELARARRWNTPSALAFALRTAGPRRGRRRRASSGCGAGARRARRHLGPASTRRVRASRARRRAAPRGPPP